MGLEIVSVSLFDEDLLHTLTCNINHGTQEILRLVQTAPTFVLSDAMRSKE